MRAARWHARRDIRINDVPTPEPAPDEVLLRVLFCGICGTDLEEYRESPLTVPVDTPHPGQRTVSAADARPRQSRALVRTGGVVVALGLRPGSPDSGALKVLIDCT